MTGWTCTACTLENANPSGLACELCRTERVFPAAAAAAAGPSAPAVQNRASDAVPDAEEDDRYIDAHHGPLHVEDIGGSSGGNSDDALDDDDRKPSALVAMAAPVSSSVHRTNNHAGTRNCNNDAGEDFQAPSPAPRLNRGKRSAVICLDDSSDDDSDSDASSDGGGGGDCGDDGDISASSDSVRLIPSSASDDEDDDDELPPPSGLHASSACSSIRNPYTGSNAAAACSSCPPSSSVSSAVAAARAPAQAHAAPADLESHANATLQRHWGPTHQLRPFQLRAIQALCDNRDALVVSGTGSGKSLCFQLPPLLSAGGDGIAIVISPLISLMRDQVDSLRRKGIKAEFVGSAQDDPAAERRALNGEISVVYCCPESLPRVGGALCRLHDRLFLRHGGGRSGGVGGDPDGPRSWRPPPMILAIDEAHCVSSWGNDFRKDYRAIGPFRRRFLPRCPCIALTATATPRVRQDMIKSLAFDRSAHIAIESFNRPNIHYSAAHCENNAAATVEIAKLMCPILDTRRSTGSKGPSAIVYLPTRKDCDDMAQRLNVALLQSARNNGWRPKIVMAEPYHAGHSAERRQETQTRWTDGRTMCCVATVAFGMGIDRASVRLVVHVGWPQSLEAFYQESGRAGRDGNPARSVLLIPSTTVPLLFPSQNRSRETSDILKKMLWKMNEYGAATSIGCRRRHVLGYFGEECREVSVGARCCDLCDLKMAQQPQGGASRQTSLTYLHDSFRVSHLPTRPEALLGASVAVLKMVDSSGATDGSVGVHSVKPFFVKLAEEGGISTSWKWIRGLCRLLAREGWLGRELRTITCTRPKTDGRKKNGRRGKRKKRRNKRSVEVEVFEKRVEVIYVTPLGRALISYSAGGEPLLLHDVPDIEKVRHAMVSDLTYWPDLDMQEEAKANPRHLRASVLSTRTGNTSSERRNDAENVPPRGQSSLSLSTTVGGGAGRSRSRPNDLIGWRAF